MRDLRAFEESYSAPEDTPTINDKDWPKTMDSLSEYLCYYLGETKIPLAYVIRDDVDIPADPDPAATVQYEMIFRAPHHTGDPNSTPKITFKTDNHKLWDLLLQICHDHNCWTYSKSSQQTHNGHLAYQNLSLIHI